MLNHLAEERSRLVPHLAVLCRLALADLEDARLDKLDDDNERDAALVRLLQRARLVAVALWHSMLIRPFGYIVTRNLAEFELVL